jgi:hypothetical protein
MSKENILSAWIDGFIGFRLMWKNLNSHHLVCADNLNNKNQVKLSSLGRPSGPLA